MRKIYYNENNKHAAAWLRKLITAGEIAEGVVDERSIEHVLPGELSGFTQCHFFAGIGGWSRALRLAGWDDDKSVWTGSCPCQSFSRAGKGAGFDDERDLWTTWFRLIEKCKPATVFGEQVEAAIGYGWLDRLQTDLEGAEYAVASAVLPAASVGATHLRDRLYFVGHANSQHAEEFAEQGTEASRDSVVDDFWADAEWVQCPDGKRRAIKPGIRALANGIPGQLALLRGAGNAIVPQQAAEFIRAAGR